jgi:hypothetical protein
VLAKQAPILIGVVAAIIGFSLMASEMKKFRQSQREDRFVDVDDSRTESDRRFQARILNEIKSIKAQSGSLTPETIEALISDATEKKTLDNEMLFSSFENYFSEIRNLLVDQAHVADKKASILLDKGTAYSKGGITFFIVSIIVKSIFDKYMLSFLTIKSVGNTTENSDDKYKAMLKVLEDEIKWPETYLLKHGDISFAKEAMETMTHFAKAMKSEVKSKGD